MRRKVVLFCIAGTAWLVLGCRNDERQIAELHAAAVSVHPLVHTSTDFIDTFRESFPLQVAVFCSNPSESILGLVHTLREMGVPFFVTRDLDQALRHRLVILSTDTDGHTFTDDQVRKLSLHVARGRSILAFNVFAGGLRSLFGFRDYVPSRHRHRVRFELDGDPLQSYINRPEEREISLGSPKYDEIFWTNGYATEGPAVVLARFEDGTAAVVRKKTGEGYTYLIGLSLQDAVLRNQVNRDYDAERHYANAFEPGSDVWMLIVRAWYESTQTNAVRLATIPDGQSSVLLISHDVDWENSFDPALDFALMENRNKAKSTFFIQTKYVSDANSRAFFFGRNLDDLKRLQSLDFSLGSHSVIHSRGFNKFDLGTGKEALINYRPQGTGFDTATGASVLGEVVVSKQLLDGELPGQRTVFFRAGHLRVPPTLPEALERCGYAFDSSFTAPDVLTNFPYALPVGLGFVEDSGLFEFPVTLEDEESPSLEQRVDQALEVVRANAENGAISVILIHSNESQHKLRAEQELLRKLPSDIGVTDMVGFAQFWRSRDRVKWEVSDSRDSSTTRLSVTAEEAIDGLTFSFQREIDSVASPAKFSQNQHQVVLKSLKAGESAILDIRYRVK
jgi:hypothetical protein